MKRCGNKGKTAFDIVQPSPRKSYQVTIDGKKEGILKGVNKARMEMPLDEKHHLVLSEME